MNLFLRVGLFLVHTYLELGNTGKLANQISSFFSSTRCRSPVSISSHNKQEQEVRTLAYLFVLAKVQEGVNERQL